MRRWLRSSPDLQSTRFTVCAGQDAHPRLDKTHVPWHGHGTALSGLCASTRGPPGFASHGDHSARLASGSRCLRAAGTSGQWLIVCPFASAAALEQGGGVSEGFIVGSRQLSKLGGGHDVVPQYDVDNTIWPCAEVAWRCHGESATCSWFIRLALVAAAAQGCGSGRGRRGSSGRYQEGHGGTSAWW